MIPFIISTATRIQFFRTLRANLFFTPTVMVFPGNNITTWAMFTKFPIIWNGMKRFFSISVNSYCLILAATIHIFKVRATR